MRRSRLLVALGIVVFGLITYWGSRVVNPITGEVQHIALDPQQEIALGLQSAPQMAAELGGVEPDRSIQADVAGIGRRLVAGSTARQSPYRFSFTVLADRRTVNAFALPGGPIFITRGLLDRLENEAELGAVLGHEIGHVIGRHAAARIAKDQLAQTLVGAVGVATSDADGRGRQAAAVAAVVAQVVGLRYGRQDELQADTLGVRVMSEAGYDPRAMLSVMEILARVSAGNRQPEFLSTHPDPGNREEAIRQAIAERYPEGVDPRLTLGRSIRLGDGE
jgi:predicted Zn-dependent protease